MILQIPKNLDLSKSNNRKKFIKPSISKNEKNIGRPPLLSSFSLVRFYTFLVIRGTCSCGYTYSREGEWATWESTGSVLSLVLLGRVWSSNSSGGGGGRYSKRGRAWTPTSSTKNLRLKKTKSRWPLPVYALSCLWYRYLHLSTSFMTKIYARVKRQWPLPVYALSCLWYLHLSTSFITKIYARDSGGHRQSMHSLVCGIYTSVITKLRKRQWPSPVYGLSCLWYLQLSTVLSCL